MIWNFGVTQAGADAGVALNTLRITIKGSGQNSSSADAVTLQIYSGLGGSGTLLGTVVIPYTDLNTNSSNYFNYDSGITLASTGLVGNLSLAAGGYSVKMTTGYSKGYNFKAGTTNLVDGTTGGVLANSSIWFADANATGAGTTYFTATASTPIQANANFSAKSISFGNYRVGDTKSQTITLSNGAFFSTDGTNNADGSPKLTTQALKISSATASGGSVSYGTFTSQTYVSGAAVTSTSAGSFAPSSNTVNAPLTAIASNNSTNVNIAIDTTTAGNKSGSIVFGLQSVQGNSIATPVSTLNDETVTFTGTGYRAAIANLSTTNAALGKFRVGDSGSTSITVSNSATSGDSYSEKLSVYDKTLTGNATVGTLPASLITAGSNSSVSVGLNSITAGANSSAVTLKFKSDGTNTSGLTALNLADQTVNVTAIGYRAAVASLSSTTAALGNFRVGDTANSTITISNSATSGDSYSEKLSVTGKTVTGSATAGTLPTGLINAASNSTLSVGLGSIVAGSNTGTVKLNFKSDGTGTSELTALDLADQTINLSATGYRAATYSVSDVLDLGKFHVGASNVTGSISIQNSATNDAYSEKLAVSKKSSSGLSTGSTPSLIAAGNSSSLGVTLSSVSSVGTNSANVVLGMASDGTGTSGLSALTLSDKTVNVTATGYSGQASWSKNTGGTWNTFNNWNSDGGKPGVDGALSVDDQATFGSGVTGNTNITLDGSNPVLTKITFNNADANYSIGKGTGNGSVTLGTTQNTASVINTAGSHSISADVSLARNTAFSVNTGTVLTMLGALNGTGAVTKTGDGTLHITGTGDLTGNTTVSAGRLRVNGSIAGSTVLVESGAILSGSGTVGSTTVASGATIGPGNSPGNLTIDGNLTLEAGANFNWDIYDATGVRGSGWDTITVTGDLNLSALSPSNKYIINFNSLTAFDPDIQGDAYNFASNLSYRWNIISAGSITNFDVRNFTLYTTANNGQGGFSNQYSGTFSIQKYGNDLDIVYTAAANVPEPSTYGLGLGALAIAAAMVRRRKRQA